jgi:hypothetical protein
MSERPAGDMRPNDQQRNDRPKYQDPRCDFWREHFSRALEYDAYLSASDPARAQRWRDMEGKIPPLAEEEKRRLSGHGRRMNVLVYSGVWCGDCVRQGPMLLRIAQACGPDVRVRLIDREASAALGEELRILAGLRVPVVVFLSEDFCEAGRFGDRMLAAYRAKAARELGPACETGIVAPPLEQLRAEQAEWVDVFERMLLMLRLAPALRERYGD